MCSYGVGNVGTYNNTFVHEDIAAQPFNPAGEYNYTQLLNQARNQTYIITELFSNLDISPMMFSLFLPNEAIPTTDFLSITVPTDISKVTTFIMRSTKTKTITPSIIPVTTFVIRPTKTKSIILDTSNVQTTSATMKASPVITPTVVKSFDGSVFHVTVHNFHCV